jgi:hypothetical protein
MTLMERIKVWLHLAPASAPATETATEEKASRRRALGDIVRGVRSLGGGRTTIDRPEDSFNTALSKFVRFHGDDTYWRGYKLDPASLERIPMRKLMEILAEVSPDVSRALWDFILFMNPGWEWKAYKPGTETVDRRATEALEAFYKNLHGPYTVSHVVPADVVIGSLIMGPAMRGGIFAELVLDQNAAMPLEIATPDPVTIEFDRAEDSDRGLRWKLVQLQNGQWVELDRPTIWYVPIHPFPGSPKGRALFSPAVFTTLFLIGLMHDLRRVISQQGYPRLDIELQYDKLKSLMPEGTEGDLDLFLAWEAALIKAVQDHYRALKPDDAFIHGNTSKINNPVGTVNAKDMGAVEGIITALERMSVRALKTMPLLFGINEATSETHANRQWEIHVAGIKSMQHLVEFVMESIGDIALQVQGIQAVTKFKFAELRAAELLRDAQVETLNIANAARKRDEGWVTQDEAATSITGHVAVSPTPIAPTSSTAGAGAMGAQADPGSNRNTNGNGHRSFSQDLTALVMKHATPTPTSDHTEAGGLQ